MKTSKTIQFTLCVMLLFGVFLTACSGSAAKGAANDGIGASDNGIGASNNGIGASNNGSVVKTEKGQYTNISVTELQGMLKHKDFTFINVHVPYKGHIAQTDAFIPYDQIDKNLDKLPADKNAKIVLYCHGGNMSQTAARTLANLGYTNVYQLVGGFADWKAAGLPLETRQP